MGWPLYPAGDSKLQSFCWSPGGGTVEATVRGGVCREPEFMQAGVKGFKCYLKKKKKFRAG